jgi:hypothetical protein
MGNCYSGDKRLTDDELIALKGKFFIENGYDIDDSYVCAGYLRRYCDNLEVRPSGLESLVPAIQHIYPVRLSVSISRNGMVVWAGYD